MENKIGIIAAMNEEMAEIKLKMKNINEKEILGLKFFEGTINEKECVLVEGGIGKVNAARTTQIMIDNFKLEYVINIGTAGGLNKVLGVTDVVIGEKLVQHDFDITAFGREKGFITGVGKFIETDKNLVEKCKNVMDLLNKENKFQVITGTIASGDLFCTDTKLAENIRNEFNADCVEMEGAAIAQICYLDKVPFIVVRSISDSPNGKNHMDFDEYLEVASKRGAEFLEKLLSV